MVKTLRPYQQDLLWNILEEIPKHEKLCVQLSTGGGKTVVFTELVNQLNEKTLILVDSIDLVNQTIDTFKKQGFDVGSVLAGNKNIPENKVIIAMVKSLWNRRDQMPNFKYCIVDECHKWEYNKLFQYLKDTKIIGFTATPVRLKRYKLDELTTAQETMSDVYDHLICGKNIKYLIDNKFLVKDKNILIDFDSSGLKTDASGEFTASSLKEVFQKEEYQKALRKSYELNCEGKKTMIFTSSIETNEVFRKLFQDKNVRTYDSDLQKKGVVRDEIVNWFKNTPDAILINTGCFTTGFDVCDVECIMVARATKSLALWIQICGRGARITNKIEKNHILIVDGGNNIEEHGTFSFDRNWQKLFSDKKIKNIIDPMQECEDCGFNFPEIDNKCPYCGKEVDKKEGEEKPKDLKEFKINGQKSKLIPPEIDLTFFINKGLTDYEALKVLEQKWIVFLTKSEIKKETFDFHLESGTFDKKFSVLLKPFYLQIIRSILKKGKNVKWESYKKRILTKSYKNKYGINN